MVGQPDSPPNSSEYKTQNPVPHVEPTVDNANNASSGSVKEKSETSVFVNSEPIREEQVQNAVKFLSHPKVRGSPVQYRRSFLEKKGLTKEEIDEAFRRVPDPTPTVSTSPAVVANQDGSKTSPSIQPQALSQTQQQAPGVPSASVSKFGTISHFHWTHALLAVGVLAASGAGTAVLFKKSIIPRLKSWIRKVVLEEEEEAADKYVSKNKPSLEEEATAAAKAAATAAADVARASQEMLIAKTEEKKYFEELTKLLNVQVHEMKSMSNALQKLEGQSNASVRVATLDNDDQRIAMTQSKQMYTNGTMDVYSGPVKSPAPSTSVEPSVAPHPKSYMEIMSMIERGEKPSNIRDINDQPPNPNQPVPNPRVAPKLKPWEIGQSQINSVNGVQYQESSNHGVSMFSQTSQFNGDGGSSVPWSQNKNLRISEIETEDNNNQKTDSSSSVFNERPVQQRSWVPPQPPPVAMQEAAAAIRQPKKLPTQRSQSYTDDQLLARSSEITDELQKATELSESGGAISNVDGGIVSHGFSSNEIQQEDGNSYVEA